MEEDEDIQERFERAQKRSHILITFAKIETVPKSVNKPPVQVEWLMIPFSPDLDPETVYVRPGKPFRAFADFYPSNCDRIRSTLVKAGIYAPNPDPKIDTTPKDPLPPR